MIPALERLLRWSSARGATSPLAVKFDRHGDIDVLKVVEVARPVPGPGQVLVKVVAAGINPGEGLHPPRVATRHVACHLPFGPGK